MTKNNASVIQAVAFLLLGSLLFVATARGDTQLRPLVAFFGADTRIARIDYLRITTAESWTQLWLEHVGKPGLAKEHDPYHNPSGAPEVDFSQCMVVAIILSPGSGCAGVNAVSITESPEAITFDFDAMAYQFRAGMSAPGNAYGYFVLPRSDKPLVLRKNVTTSMTRVPPVWKEVKRFEGLKVPVEK
jgi:hypothetical protein